MSLRFGEVHAHPGKADFKKQDGGHSGASQVATAWQPKGGHLSGKS